MSDAIFLIVCLGIVVMEVVEVRDKCEQLPTGIWERTCSWSRDWSARPGDDGRGIVGLEDGT